MKPSAGPTTKGAARPDGFRRGWTTFATRVRRRWWLLLIFASVCLLVLLALAAVALGDVTALLAAGVAATSTLLAAVALTVHLERKVEQSERRILRHTEAFLWLSRELGSAPPLPPTGGWAAEPDLLLELARLVDRGHPSLVLELGSGISTLVMAQRLRALGSGKVIALEHDPDFADQTRASLRDAGLDAYAQVIDAPLDDVTIDGSTWRWYRLPELDAGAHVGLLVVDGPPSIAGRLSRYPALPQLRHYLASTAAIVVDDADRPDEQEMVDRWLLENPGLKARYLPLERGAYVLQFS